ncbi:LysR family transcriptional regulator [Paraburkholderia sp. SIMBA_030]|uniref:LysR family transcriptional regulator n=1 Tax=Paraburkholderia sp. SIMBA_030 TaxID=3085773 RepID=UPI00397A6F9A
MAREGYSDLLAFLVVARERSFTRAAAQLGMSQSGLSHTIKDLESKLGLRLLTRSTRSVATTEAGERLYQAIAPRFQEIDGEVAALAEFRDKAAGTIRITATDHPVDTVILPKLKSFLVENPDVKIEITVDYGLTDIVAQRYDIGVRFGDQVAKDMIAVRISPDLQWCIVGSPEYFAQREAPQSLQDLVDHDCITQRLPTSGGLHAWDLRDGDRDVQVRVNGKLTFNGEHQLLNAALTIGGLAFLPEDVVAPYIQEGRLVAVMKDWCPVYPGYHAYYASRRQPSRALALVIDALRYRNS